MIQLFKRYYEQLNNYINEYFPEYYLYYSSKKEAEIDKRATVRLAIKEYINYYTGEDSKQIAEDFAQQTLTAGLTPNPFDYYYDEFLDNNFTWFYIIYKDLNESLQEKIKAKLRPILFEVFKDMGGVDLSQHHHLVDDKLYTITVKYIESIITDYIAIQPTVIVNGQYPEKPEIMIS